MPKIDEESKELTALFANTFAHYIIEKMEIRIVQELGEDKIEHLGTRDEEITKAIVSYFDDMFEELLMERKELDDNENCPCGSGKKYKNCCKKKNFTYYEEEDEHYTKSIPIHPDLKIVLDEEALKFKRIFGRMPGNDDYVFGGVLFKDLKRAYKLMKRKNIVDKAWLYASEQTGIMLTKENQDLISEKDAKEFISYIKKYQKLMKSKIKGGKWNSLQAVESTNFILETMINRDLNDMIYVLNLCVNFYSKEVQEKDNYIIHNIKDFLIFCAYKASIQLKVLQELVNGEYYDTAMAEIRIIYEILISMRAYKRNLDLFEEKILSVVGIELGTHQKVENKKIIEEIKTGKQYKYGIQKRQLAKESGANYEKLYITFYQELSSFIHLDTESAKGIFQETDLFLDVDECLEAGFIGMILGLEIIMELIEFDDNDKKVSRDLKYFSNKLLKDFLAVISTIILIEDKKVFHILEDTLKEYKTDYKINYQRNQKNEVY